MGVKACMGIFVRVGVSARMGVNTYRHTWESRMGANTCMGVNKYRHTWESIHILESIYMSESTDAIGVNAHKI